LALSRHPKDSSLKTIAQLHSDGLLVSTDPFFTTRREQIVQLATKLAVPTVYPFREFAAVGGVASYGPSLAAGWRQVGIYAGRILKGDKPADLAVMQPTTFELVINLNAAQSLKISIPATLHARSDDVID
jgi:putative tryptophan/tyrosine transport system substrate-binding protein